MKQVTKMSRCVSMIEGVYNSTNADLWDNALPPVIITVESSPESYAHTTRNRVWKRKEDNLFELSISSEYLSYPIETLLDSVIHEQIHVFCRVNEIAETSRNGYYHNRKFKELAESHGLKCVYTGSSYGWNTTEEGNDFLIEYALQKGYSELQISRNTPRRGFLLGTTEASHTGTHVAGAKAPSSTRKLICPSCTQTVRATRKVNIICGNCMTKMIEV